MILNKPYTSTDYADFAVQANSNGQRVEQDDNAIYALFEYEILQNGEVIDISQTPEYVTQQINIKSAEAYNAIIQKYDEVLKFGVFKIYDNYYANMAWDKTWSNVLNLYTIPPTGFIPPESFNVRLYISHHDKYYNVNTTQTISLLSQLSPILKSKQFLYYQPIQNNLLAQLRIYKDSQDMAGLNNIITACDTAFGDMLDETKTIVEYEV